MYGLFLPLHFFPLCQFLEQISDHKLLPVLNEEYHAFLENRTTGLLKDILILHN